MTLPLPHHQAKLLEFIRAHLSTHGITPSVDEMRVFLGARSKSSVGRLLDRLELAGRIRRRARCARGIEVLPDAAHHEADCFCYPCARARYAASLNLLNAITFGPSTKVLRTLVGLRSPTIGERAGMLGIRLNGGSRKHAANRTARP